MSELSHADELSSGNRFAIQMDRVALITGGGRGLGRAFAVALAKNGLDVAVASRNTEELNATVALLRAEQVRCVAIPTDVTNDAAVRKMVSITQEQLGPISLLVNAAGVGVPFGPTWETDSDEWWRNVEVNLKGPMLCCKAVVTDMIARRNGRIINVASGAGTVSIPYMSAYVTSKAAVIRFTEVLADEVREHGVSVFAIQPGTVRTAMAEELMQSESGKRWLPWFKKIFDENRDDSSLHGEKLVLYLASGKADVLSGRFFAAPGAPDNVVDQLDQILNDNRNVLRIRL
jgi:NAD(P)-dependent dehydrogenase (short-subunit alcohol dehydrogenase family)